MRTAQQRQELVVLIEDAIASGARQKQACKIAGITARTLQRWKPSGTEDLKYDRRPVAVRPMPPNQLSPEDRQKVLEVCNQSEYASLPPTQIVPKLADQGTYLASESTMYRILKSEGQLNTRGRTRKRRSVGLPRTHMAYAL